MGVWGCRQLLCTPFALKFSMYNMAKFGKCQKFSYLFARLESTVAGAYQNIRPQKKKTDGSKCIYSRTVDGLIYPFNPHQSAAGHDFTSCCKFTLAPDSIEAVHFSNFILLTLFRAYWGSDEPRILRAIPGGTVKPLSWITSKYSPLLPLFPRSAHVIQLKVDFPYKTPRSWPKYSSSNLAIKFASGPLEGVQEDMWGLVD